MFLKHFFSNHELRWSRHFRLGFGSLWWRHGLGHCIAGRQSQWVKRLRSFSSLTSLVCPSSELRRRVDTTDIQNSFEIQCQHKYHKWTRIVLRNWKDFIVSLCFFSFFILRLTLYSCRPAVEPLIGYFMPVAQLSSSVFQEDSASYIQLGRNTVIFRVAMQSGSFEEPWGYFPRLCHEFLNEKSIVQKECDDFQSRRLHTFREQSVTWEPRKGDTTDTHVHRKLAYL